MYCNNIVEACLHAMLLPEQQLLFPSVGYEGAEWDRWGAGGPGKTREARDTCKHEHTLLHDSIERVRYNGAQFESAKFTNSW